MTDAEIRARIIAKLAVQRLDRDEMVMARLDEIGTRARAVVDAMLARDSHAPSGMPTLILFARAEEFLAMSDALAAHDAAAFNEEAKI